MEPRPTQVAREVDAQDALDRNLSPSAELCEPQDGIQQLGGWDKVPTAKGGEERELVASAQPQARLPAQPGFL